MKENELLVEILYHSDKDYQVISGGNSENLSWAEYLDLYKDEFRQYFVLIKEAIQQAGLIGETGEQMQNLGISFLFSNGQHWAFTWRGWGDLMQSIVDNKEGYMKYYM